MTVSKLAYAGSAYARLPYAGYVPAIISPTIDPQGVPFLVANDRYQVVVCADSGTESSIPVFRYWYAGPPTWGEQLAGDTLAPLFYSQDELGNAVVGQFELPLREFAYITHRVFRTFHANIDGVWVEFTPRPSSISEGIDQSATVGFSLHIEAVGVQGYARQDADLTYGVEVSDTATFSESITVQGDAVWPNTQVAWLPLRMTQRAVAARIVFDSVELVEINLVRLMGNLTTDRTV